MLNSDLESLTCTEQEAKLSLG